MHISESAVFEFGGKKSCKKVLDGLLLLEILCPDVSGISREVAAAAD